MSKKIKKGNEIKSLKVWKETPKSVLKLEFNENKWTEYTKKINEEIPIRKCVEAEDKCNSVIKTKGVDQAW